MLSSPAYITDSWGDWKVEEMSPPSPQLYPSPPPSDAIDSVPIYSFEDYNSITFSTEDPLKHEILLVDDDIVESKAQVASKLLDDLDHLEQLDQWIKEGKTQSHYYNPFILIKKIKIKFNYRKLSGKNTWLSIIFRKKTLIMENWLSGMETVDYREFLVPLTIGNI